MSSQPVNSTTVVKTKLAKDVWAKVIGIVILVAGVNVASLLVAFNHVENRTVKNASVNTAQDARLDKVEQRWDQVVSELQAMNRTLGRLEGKLDPGSD